MRYLPVFTIMLIHITSAISIAGELPRIPDIIFGVNQYNVGLPADMAKYWPVNGDEARYFKEIGCNTIRFPLYPSEIGIDEAKFMDWRTGDKFDAASLGKPDWRSLDALLDWMIQYQITPFICPVAEKRDDWSSKAWMSLHVPEQAQRTVWLTKIVVDHVTAKYGDQVIYGWFENWFWNSYKHEKSAEFPYAFRQMLKDMYNNKISSLNKNWGSKYRTFDDVEIPKLYVNNEICEEAVNSRRSYDLKKAMDLLQRDVLSDIHRYIRKKAPGAIWAGGCLLNELGGMSDIRSVSVPRTNATMRTAAVTGDIVSADMYGPRHLYYSFYRTLSKIASVEGKKFLIAEAAATKPETFQWIADIGGPSAGAIAWVGKEDDYGFIKWDGTRRIENGKKFLSLKNTYTRNRSMYDSYRPGRILVYFPEETLYYSISARNQMDSYLHICDHMMPEELEPVLTDELSGLALDKRIYVLERTIPLKAIKVLEKMGDRVICPHECFVDENGMRHIRKTSGTDFYKRLLSDPDGAKLLDVFQRVEEKEQNIAYRYYGSTISSPSELAAVNQVISGRENDINYLIDGSVNEGITFPDKKQNELVYLKFNQPKSIYGAFVQFYEGDGQTTDASRLPSKITIRTSMDAVNYNEVIALTGTTASMRPHIRFKNIQARYVCIDFGENAGGSGLKIEEVGILGKR